VQPLDGLTVLDFTTLLPGPLATLMLAEAGAHVIKVERPGGEDMRHYPPFLEGKPVLFEQLNTGKEFVEIDLKSDTDRDRLDTLVGEADILVEQFRPGVMARLGLDYDTVSKRHPELIYCSITGYGQTGPRAAAAGHDLNYQALTGLLAQSCGTSDHPSLPPAQIADIGGGSFPAVTNILLAVLQRQKTGRGSHLDIAMSDTMFTFALFAQAQRIAGQHIDEYGSGLLTGGSPRYRLYPAADGKMIAVAALEEKFWQALCDLLDIPAALRNDRQDPDLTAKAVAEAFHSRSSHEWEPLLAAADCCVTPVKSIKEGTGDPHFVQRGLFDRKLPDGAAMEQIVLPIASPFRRVNKD